MASVFDPNIGASVSYSPIVEQPIQDTTTPALVGAVARLGVGLARNSAIRSLTGEGRSVAEAEEDAAFLPTDGTPAEQEAALNSIDTLTKLASARKAGLPIGQARTRATSILKRAVNDNPMFANDVRKAYNQFFGGTGVGGVFELTAEEKALEKYKEEVTHDSLVFGTTPEQSALKIRQRAMDEETKREYELQAKERTLNADTYVNYADINTNQQVGSVMDRIVAEVKQKGALQPDAVQAYQAELRLLGSALKRQQAGLLRDENGQPILNIVDRGGIDAANSLIDKEINHAISLVTDSTLLKLSSDNYTILNNNYNTAVLNNFAQFKAVKDALGEQGAQLYFQKMLGNKEFAAVAQNDPFVRNVLRAGDNFQRDFMGATAEAMGNAVGDGSPVTDKVKAGWLGVLATDTTKNAVGAMLKVPENNVAELTKLSVQESPMALSVFKNESWRMKLKSDPAKYMPVVDAALTGAGKAARAKLISDIDSFDFSNITIESGTVGRVNPDYTVTNVPHGIVVRGNGVSPELKTQIENMFQIADSNPSVWKGKADSAVDYVRNLMSLPSRTPVQEPAQQPAVDNEQAKVRAFIEDSARYQRGEVSKDYMMESYSSAFVKKLTREFFNWEDAS